MIEVIDKKQQSKLYEIAKLTIRNFELQMSDHWEDSDYSEYGRNAVELQRLILEYALEYDDHPGWDNIEEVYAFVKSVEEVNCDEKD